MKNNKIKRGSQEKQEEWEMESITYKIGKDGKERRIKRVWRVKTPRINSWVKPDYKNIEKRNHKYFRKTFPQKDIMPRYIYMGECPNMQGHCFIFDFKKQTMLGMYHIEDFVELTEDEV